MLVAHIGKLQENTAALCKKWLRNSPGKCYQRIRICLTEEVETPSFPIQICLPDVKYQEKVVRHPNRIPDVGYPEKMERHKGDRWRVHGVGTHPEQLHPDSPSGHRYPDQLHLDFSSGHAALANITHPDDSISYPDTALAIITPGLLAFWICLWQRTSKLRFFMFLSFPLFCHGFQRTLLNHRLLW